MTTDVGPSELLYYPAIEIRSEPWLKAALCIWDRVYRIVPQGYTPNDSDLVKEAIDNDLVRPIPFTEADLGQARADFEAFWERVPCEPAGIDGDAVRLHPGKVDAQLLPVLKALAQKIDPDGFLTVPEHLANAYMLFLADSVVRSKGIGKATDDPRMFSVMQYFENDGDFDEFCLNTEATEATLALTIPMVLPGGLNDAGLNEVLELRKRTKASRASFRNTVVAFAADLAQVEGSEFQRQRLADFREQLQKDINSLTTDIVAVGKDVLWNLITMGAPATMGAYLELQGEANVDSAQNLLLVSLVAALASSTSVARQAWSARRASFYWTAQHMFPSPRVVKWTTPAFDRSLNEFVND